MPLKKSSSTMHPLCVATHVGLGAASGSTEVSTSARGAHGKPLPKVRVDGLCVPMNIKGPWL